MGLLNYGLITFLMTTATAPSSKDVSIFTMSNSDMQRMNKDRMISMIPTEESVRSKRVNK